MQYDITPSNFINMVVCELGFIPPTSVPVVIREFSKEDIEI
jgi:translation initiation factor eIF-2B subunit delta